MQERPVVTVVAWGRPAASTTPAPKRRRRRFLAPRSAAVVLAVLLPLLAADVLAVRQLHERHAETAFAVADRVGLRFTFTSLSSEDDGSGTGRVAALLSVEGDQAADRVVAPSLSGPTLTTEGSVPAVMDDGRTGLVVLARADCARVAREPGPARAAVELVVVPPSGVRHHVMVAVPDPLVRQQALLACNAPDPVAATTAEASVVASGPVLYVGEVQRHRRPVVLESVRAPGLAITVKGTPLPHRLPDAAGVVFDLQVRVIDCATVRRRPIKLTVGLSDDSGRHLVLAGPMTSQPQPGGVQLGQGLRRLVDGVCAHG